METIILTILAFVLGYKISGFIHVMSFKKILEDLGIGQQDLLKVKDKVQRDLEDLESPSKSSADNDGKTVVEIKIEEMQGQLYAFELTKDTFIAQGQNSEELVERLLQKLPINTRIICDRSNGGELITDAVEKLAERKA